MLYTRQPPVPPSYSGSLFRRRGEGDTETREPQEDAESTPERECADGAALTAESAEQEEICSPPPEESEKKEEETAPVSARAREKHPSLLSRFGLDRLFGFDLEDLLILVLAFILLAEDGDIDPLLLLFALFLTGK